MRCKAFAKNTCKGNTLPSKQVDTNVLHPKYAPCKNFREAKSGSVFIINVKAFSWAMEVGAADGGEEGELVRIDQSEW